MLGNAENIAREFVETYCPRRASRKVEHHAISRRNDGAIRPRRESGWRRSGTLSHVQLADAGKAVRKRYEEKEKQFGEKMMRWLKRRIVLDIVDSQWKDHLLTLDHLKEGIGLRGYGQKDPIVEFKKEAFTLFEDMMGRIDTETMRYLFHIVIQQAQQHPDDMQTSPDAQGGPRPSPPQVHPPQRRSHREWADHPPQWPAPPHARRNRRRSACPMLRAQLDRKQQRQQQDLQYQTGAAQAEPPKPRPRRRQSRPQRSLPLRLRQKIQKMPRAKANSQLVVGRSGGLPFSISNHIARRAITHLNNIVPIIVATDRNSGFRI